MELALQTLYSIDVGLLLSEGIYLFYLCIFSSRRLWQNINAMGWFSGISRQPFPEIEFSTLRDLRKKHLFFAFPSAACKASLAESFEAHLQYLSKLSLLHTHKRYRLLVSVSRAINLLTCGRTEITLIISFAIATSSLFCFE